MNHLTSALLATLLTGLATAGRCQQCSSYWIGAGFFVTWLVLWWVFNQYKRKE